MGLFSLAELPEGNKSGRIRRGHLAIPESPEPCHTVAISIQHTDSGESTPPLSLQRLRKVFNTSICQCRNTYTCRNTRKSSTLLSRDTLRFNSLCIGQRKARLNNKQPLFRILLQNSRYYILDDHSGKVFPYIESLEATQNGVEETIYELVYALERLWKFKHLFNSRKSIEKHFSFTKVDKNPKSDVKKGGKFTYKFKNRSCRQQLYFCLLNMLPSGEIQQFRPRQGFGLEHVEPGGKVRRNVIVEMLISMAGIKQAPETYKVIVATQQSSFGMY